MRILTALMSTIFGLLLLLATVMSWTIFVEGMCKSALDVWGLVVSRPLAMMLAILFLALLNWVLFRILDWIYRCIHPAAYEPLGPVVNVPGLSFTMVQSVICSLRSSALCVAVPNVSFGLSLMPLVLLLLLTADAGDMAANSLWLVAAAELLMMGLLGWVVQWRYSRTVLAANATEICCNVRRSGGREAGPPSGRETAIPCPQCGRTDPNIQAGR